MCIIIDFFKLIQLFADTMTYYRMRQHYIPSISLPLKASKGETSYETKFERITIIDANYLDNTTLLSAPLFGRRGCGTDERKN